MDSLQIRNHIVSIICERVSEDSTRRTEALREFFSVVAPREVDGPVGKWCDNIPAILPNLYEKWALQYADRMIETVPMQQLELLCEDSDENNAAIALAFVMFLESARMERQVASDLMSSCVYPIQNDQDASLQEAIANAVGARLRGLISDK